MSSRRVLATKRPQGDPGAFAGVCARCGIERGPDARRGSLCRDCRDVDPRWGRRDRAHTKPI